MQEMYSAGQRKRKWGPSKSFWITVAVWLLLLIPFAATGGLAVWVLLFAVFAILTALYSLVFGRRSWAGLPHRTAAGAGVGAGFMIFVLGVMGAGLGAPASAPASLADAKLAATETALPTPRSILMTACAKDGEEAVKADGKYVCTADYDGSLVWMTGETSKKLLADRAEATARAEADASVTKKAAEVKAAADKAVADKAAADKAVVDKAAADKAAADKAAGAAAAGAEAARV